MTLWIATHPHTCPVDKPVMSSSQISVYDVSSLKRAIDATSIHRTALMESFHRVKNQIRLTISVFDAAGFPILPVACNFIGKNGFGRTY